MKRAHVWTALAPALIALCGCGGAARQEGARLGKVLTQGRDGFTAANNTEKDLVAAGRNWVAGITAGGAGTGSRLEQNAGVAGDLAKSADTVSNQLGQLRKAVYDQPLQQEFTQGVRSTLITQITKRQRTLQELRAALLESQTQLHALGETRGFKGDSYPQAVDKVNQILEGYAAPADVVGDALASLKNEYGFKDPELAPHPTQ